MPIIQQGLLAMCELSNEQVFSNWQECNRENRQQGADYWHDFMSKRAKRGYKGAQAVVDKMDRLKQRGKRWQHHADSTYALTL